MERMTYHRRDTPEHFPMTSSSQWSGYLRSTLAELAIKESVDESVETGLELAEERREMERTCYPRKCETGRQDDLRCSGFPSKDTPAHIDDKTRRIKCPFNRGGAEGLIPEEETKTEEKRTDKQKRSQKHRLKQRQRGQESTDSKIPRRKINVGPIEAPPINNLTDSTR